MSKETVELVERMEEDSSQKEPVMVKSKYNRNTSLLTGFVGDGYEEPALYTQFAPSVTDPTYFRSNSDLIKEFMLSGQVLSSARLQQYDFQDGIDDGSPVPATRNIGLEPEEVTQVMESTLERARMRAEYSRLQASKREDRNISLKELKEALSANPRASESNSESNPADKNGVSENVAQGASK